MRALTVVLVLFLLLGCAQQRTAATLLLDLPKSDKPYVGSFIYEPWTYMGQSDGCHSLRYSYGDGGIVATRDFRVPAADVLIDPNGLPSRQAISVNEVASPNGRHILVKAKVSRFDELRYRGNPPN